MADSYLFNKAFGGGLQIGSGIASQIRERRGLRALQDVAEQIRSGNYTDASASLIGLGKLNEGLQVNQIPYQREQQALQRDFQNAQFMNQRTQQDIANQMAQERLDIARQKAAADASGMADYTTPIQAVGPDGKPVFIQTNNRGEVKPLEGYTPNNPIKTVDNGTEILTVDSRTAQVISRTPKNNEQKAFDTEKGKQTAKSVIDARSNLPKVEGQAQQMLGVIDRLENDPNMDAAMGFIQGNAPSIVAGLGGLAGSPQGIEDFRAIKSQLEGQAFLQAFDSLKGGGQITEIEGRKATDAMAAMRDTQSPEEFRRQLNILKGVIKRGVARARKSAQSAAPGSQSAINVPSPMTAGATPQDAIQISSENDLTDAMIGKYVTLNGQTFQVQAD